MGGISFSLGGAQDRLHTDQVLGIELLKSVTGTVAITGA